MKLTLIYTLLGLYLITLLTGCPSTSQIKPYVVDHNLSNKIAQGLVFSLPRTIFEVKIIYSMYEKRIWEADANGNPKKTDSAGKMPGLKTKAIVIVVDKPIEIMTKTLPDQDMKFVFDPESLNGFTKSTDITIDFTGNGIIKSTNFSVQDKTTEIVTNLTETIFNIAKIAAVAGEDVVELIHIKDVTVSRIIDPSSLIYSKINEDFTAQYSDADKSATLFGKLPVPEVVVMITSNSDIYKLSKFRSSDIKDDAGITPILNGFPYRVGEAVKVTVSINGLEIYENYHVIAQAGGLALIPINSKMFSNISQGLSFSDDGSVLIKYKSTGSSQGEAMSAAAKGATGQALSGIQSIDQVKVDKIKKDKELFESKESLKATQNVSEIQAKIDGIKKEKELNELKDSLKSTTNVSDIQAKIDAIKKEKELVEAEIALNEAKKKQ